MVKTAYVIWDWNGTLLEDVTQSYAIVEAMRASRGMPSLGGIDRYRELFHFPVIDYYRDMGYTFETETFEDITVDFLVRYGAVADSCPLTDGAVTVIDALRERGIRQMILSATGQARLETEVAAHGIADRFEVILGQKDDAGTSKAQRGLDYLKAANIDPAACVMVGDTDHDFEVAEALGCRCILFDRGHQSRTRLEPLGAPVVDGLAEVLELV